MGFLRRLLGREDDGSADPFGQPSRAGGAEAAVETKPIVSFESTPTEATWSSVTVNGKPVPPDQAQAFSAAFEQLGNLASAGSSQVIDLRGVPGLRDEVLGAMSKHAQDPGALQQAIFETLGKHGLGAGGPMSMPSPQPQQTDPVEQIRKLDELRDQGILTDAEFEAQKKKLLGEI